MKKFNLRMQIILFLIVPIALLILFISIFASYEKIEELHQDFEQRGYSLINQLMPSSKFGLFVTNSHMLQTLTNAALENPEISAVGIYDRTGKIQAYSGPDSLFKATINKQVNKTKILLEVAEGVIVTLIHSTKLLVVISRYVVFLV